MRLSLIPNPDSPTLLKYSPEYTLPTSFESKDAMQHAIFLAFPTMIVNTGDNLDISHLQFIATSHFSCLFTPFVHCFTVS